MNPLSGRIRLVATALCGIVLTACNAVQDAKTEPTIANPAAKAVLGVNISGLGTRRPVVLQYNGQDNCVQPKDPNNPSGTQIVGECAFFGVLNQATSSFSFGALAVGTPYNITVKRQPFAKICTVVNGTGTLGAGGAIATVNCVDDPAVAHYSVTVSIATAAAALPGLKVTLTTENGAWDVAATGLTTYTFADTTANPGYVFNSGASPPIMGYRVTATIPGATATDPIINCLVTGGTVANTGGNIDDSLSPAAAATAPTANVTGIQVVSCGFQVRASAEYSVPAVPSGVTPPAAPTIAAGGGVTLLLRKQPSEVDVATVKLTSFNNTLVPFTVPDAQGNPTSTPYQATSDANAFYEVVVKSAPAGMACIPGYSTTTGRAIGKVTDAGAVLLIKPASVEVAGTWIVDRVVRCRNIPPAARQLRGVYQQTGTTTSTTTVTTTAPTTTVTSSTAGNRNYLAFFEDGTYLFGAHSSSALTSGVEQGFYDYNNPLNPANQIGFAAFTDTSSTGGMHNAGAAATLTTVSKSTSGSPSVITGHYSTTNAVGVVLASGAVSVAVNGGTAISVTGATYANATTLAAAINTAATAAGSTTAIAVATSGNEIQITGPAGGVVFAGSSAGSLGLTSVAAGATLLTTGVANATKTVKTDVDWRLTEVGPDTSDHTATLLDGAWVTWDPNLLVEDRRRVFTYQHGRYQAVHIGVNGIGNMQDACYVSDAGLSGEWVRQGARSGCTLPVLTTKSDGTSSSGILASLDVPNPTTSPVLTPGFRGKWPQSTDPSYSDGRPYSPVDFEVRPAGTVPADPICPNADKLTVRDTQNGVPLDQLTPPIPAIVLCRIVAN